MRESRTFLSDEYPVLRTITRAEGAGQIGSSEDQATISLGLLVKGIPSFLATISVEEEEVDGILGSLDRGEVRLAAVGIAVNGSSLADSLAAEPEPWKGEASAPENLPAAFLSLVCADGRRIGVARIVSRESSTPPQDIARFVIDQIAQGVQIPDLASTS
jgi:hypothetical protein